MKHVITLLLVAAVAAPVLADPPAHAPAHGYRAKEGSKEARKEARKYRGYTGVEWKEDYGVRGGRCNTDTVLATIGAAGGAIIGNRTASAENRVVATIVGAIIGGVVGNEVGEAIDNTDRACIGHALEVGAAGRNITWTNPKTGLVHVMQPTADLKDGCRRFDYRVGPKGKASSLVACRSAEAAWSIRQK